MTRPRLSIRLCHALFFFSGGASLGCQMVWSKTLATGLGHEMPAVLAVVCAVMGGMAVGAWTLDGRISRSPSPWRWYGALEIVIGVWGLVSTVLVPVTNQGASSLVGLVASPLRHWSVAFGLPFIALLPATAAMGATLPAMERIVAPLTAGGRCVGGLYAANTIGAVAGVLGSAFVVAPALGLSHGIWLLAGVNCVCGVVALWMGTRTASFPTSAASGTVRRRQLEPAHLDPAFRAPFTAWRLGFTLFFTGLFGIGFETVGVRVLSQVLENTVYSFAAVLAVFLLGTAVGAALFQRLGLSRVPCGGTPRVARGPEAFQRNSSRLLLTGLLGGVSAACLLGVLTLSKAQPMYDACRATMGDGVPGVLAAELAVAAAVFLLPTIFMGATFSHLVQSARREEGGVGRAAALNTAGGALASVAFGVILLPLVGSKWTLVLISLGYLSLAPEVAGWRWGLFVLPLVLVFTLPANLQITQIPPGGRLVEYREGVMASVAVVEDADHQRVLRVDNRFQMGGTAASAAEYRQTHIPMLLHPAPKRALFLGVGTGISFGAASLYPGLQSDGVELVPEVIEVMTRFEPYNFAPGRRPQLKVFTADARRFVRAADATYDVIVADLFHPARDGAGSLYTIEHFRAIRERLAPGGLFCQWLPLHQLDNDMLRVIVRTFLEVFARAQAWLLHFNVDIPVLGLIGSVDPIHHSRDWVEARLDGAPLEAQLKKLALADSIRLFGNLLAGPEELRAFAGDAPLNTDDRPRVTFGAPRFVYRKQSIPYGRLLELLKLGHPDFAAVLGLGSGEEAGQFAQRLSKYAAARDVYLGGLIAEGEGRRARAIDLFVESARLSEDFTPGYAQCLTYASLLAQTKPDEARALLQRLAGAQPSRPVAREMLERLFPK